MKNICTFFLLKVMFTHTGFGQGITPSTIREIYHYEIGDTFEYAFHWEDNLWYNYSNGYSRIVVTGKSIVGDSVFYTTTQSNYYVSHNPPGGYPLFNGPLDGMSNLTAAFYYCEPRTSPLFKFFNLDSSVLSPFFYPDTACQSLASCFDTVFISAQYNGCKQNRHVHIGFNNIDETFGESIGLIKGSYFSETFGTSVWDSLTYYHKANGRKWGQPIFLYLNSNDLKSNNIAFHIAPNPAGKMLNIDMNGQQAEQLTIHSADGQLMFQTSHADVNAIDLSNYAKGIYMLQLKTTDGVLNKRFVKM
jgi:hypothetical protein